MWMLILFQTNHLSLSVTNSSFVCFWVEHGIENKVLVAYTFSIVRHICKVVKCNCYFLMCVHF
jgi:hypothetical protein